nr:MAG TPA: protein of unknown function (DUF1992) [Caudoviricetes sp.]
MGDFVGTFPEVRKAMQSSQEIRGFNYYVFWNDVIPSTLNPMHICSGIPSYEILADGLIILLDEVNVGKTLRLYDFDTKWSWDETNFVLKRSPKTSGYIPSWVRMMAGVTQ